MKQATHTLPDELIKAYKLKYAEYWSALLEIDLVERAQAVISEYGQFEPLGGCVNADMSVGFYEVRGLVFMKLIMCASGATIVIKLIQDATELDVEALIAQIADVDAV